MPLCNLAENIYIYFCYNFIAFVCVVKCFIISIFIALPNKTRLLQYEFLEIVAFY